jgi:hypothetical protein
MRVLDINQNIKQSPIIYIEFDDNDKNNPELLLALKNLQKSILEFLQIYYKEQFINTYYALEYIINNISSINIIAFQKRQSVIIRDGTSPFSEYYIYIKDDKLFLPINTYDLSNDGPDNFYLKNPRKYSSSIFDIRDYKDVIANYDILNNLFTIIYNKLSTSDKTKWESVIKDFNKSNIGVKFTRGISNLFSKSSTPLQQSSQSSMMPPPLPQSSQSSMMPPPLPESYQSSMMPPPLPQSYQQGGIKRTKNKKRSKRRSHSRK